MKAVLLVVVLLVAGFFSSAYAQELRENEQGCELKKFNEYAYTPFRIQLNHDPAWKQTVSKESADPSARLNFEGLDPLGQSLNQEPTTLAFYTNSTDPGWRIKVDIEWQAVSEKPRPITIAYQSAYVEIQREVVYAEGLKYCIVFAIATAVKPRQLTDDEFLELGRQAFKEEYGTIDNTIQSLIREVTITKGQNNVLSVVNVGLIAGFFIFAFMQHRSNRHLQMDYLIERNALASHRRNLSLERKQDQLDNVKWRGEVESKFTNFFNTLEIRVATILVQTKNELREEIVKILVENKIIPEQKPKETKSPQPPKAEVPVKEILAEIQKTSAPDEKSMIDKGKEIGEGIVDAGKKIIDMGKDIFKKQQTHPEQTSEVRVSWKEEYKKQWGKNPKLYSEKTIQSLNDEYTRINSLWNETKDDPTLQRLYAIHELLQEAEL